MQKDYYDVLNTDKKATQQQIKEAYRKLALEYHPDRNQDPAATLKMKEVNEAYAVLSNTEKRQEYDALEQAYGPSASSRFRQNYSEQDIFRGSDIRQVYEELSRIFGFRGFDDVFSEFYGPGYRKYEFRQPGFFARGFTYNPRSEAGRENGISFGNVLGGPLGKMLKHVLKKRWGLELPERGKDLNDRITIPPSLAQTGGKIQFVFRLKSKELIVNIPPGIKDGQKIRLRGIGENGRGGGDRGDLYLKIKIRKPLIQKIVDVFKSLLSR